jgi:hypothetical protein
MAQNKECVIIKYKGEKMVTHENIFNNGLMKTKKQNGRMKMVLSITKTGRF